jgi:hypothetical protein
VIEIDLPENAVSDPIDHVRSYADLHGNGHVTLTENYASRHDVDDVNNGEGVLTSLIFGVGVLPFDH